MDTLPPRIVDLAAERPSGYLEQSKWLAELGRAFHLDYHLRTITGSRGICFNLARSSTWMAITEGLQSSLDTEIEWCRNRIARLEAQARAAGLPELPFEG